MWFLSENVMPPFEEIFSTELDKVLNNLLNLVLILLYAPGWTMDFPKVPYNLNDYMILWNQNSVNASYSL